MATVDERVKKIIAEQLGVDVVAEEGRVVEVGRRERPVRGRLLRRHVAEESAHVVERILEHDVPLAEFPRAAEEDLVRADLVQRAAVRTVRSSAAPRAPGPRGPRRAGRCFQRYRCRPCRSLSSSLWFAPMFETISITCSIV